MFERIVLVVAAAGIAGGVGAAEPAAPLGIGAPLGAQELAARDIHVLPDGTGLPPGSGNARRGAPLYAAKCAACHGPRGEGIGDFAALVGGVGTLGSDQPKLTVGSYWPHATTVFDYIRRAMPYHSAGELTADEVYALTAWILAANGIIGRDAIMDRKTLPRVRMPNRDGFERARY